MNSHKLSTFFLIFALVSGCLPRVVGTFGKNTISHDEAISYLIATGHRDEFAQATTDIWVPASAWKRFVYPQEMFIFKQISLDLAYHDIHPPLYFWLLHIWILIFGSHIWTGPLLNVILAVATTISLFYFGNYVLGNTEEATLGVLIWSLSPAVISISWVTRQYELAALITVIFVWQIIKYSDVSESLNVTGFLCLVGVTLAGMLTVYTFPIVIMNSALLFLVVKLARKHKRRLVMILMALGFAIVLFVLSYPNFYISLTSQQAARQAFSLPYLLFRMGTVLATFIAFFVPFYNYELVTDPNFVFIFLAVGGLLIGITVLLIGHLIYRGFCLSHTQIRNYLFSEQWFQYGSGFPVIFLTCLILGFMIGGMSNIVQNCGRPDYLAGIGIFLKFKLRMTA